MSTSVYRLATSKIALGGQAEIAVYAGVQGGFITNPASAADQEIAVAEVLFLDVTKSADLFEGNTTVAIQPGQTYIITPDQATNVSVNAVTTGHKFSGVILQPPTPFPPTPVPGTFPPSEPTTLTQTIPSYLYEEYNDDDALQAFVASYNSLAQQFVSWFASISLPVYTGLSGSLLDFVALGLYGMVRPTLSSGRNRNLGPFNTYQFNTLAYNTRKIIGPQNVTVTTDDIFKRIITWNFYKGDGNIFNVRWLKRRIMRFLIEVNGTAPNVDQTYLISVTFAQGVVTIRLAVGTRRAIGGAIFNKSQFNRSQFNELDTQFIPSPGAPPLAPVLKEAIDSGALQLPFQNQFVVLI